MTKPNEQPKRDRVDWPLYRVLRAASLLSRYSVKYPRARSLLRLDVVRLRELVRKLLDRIDQLDQGEK